jgi:hypothetical protein
MSANSSPTAERAEPLGSATARPKAAIASAMSPRGHLDTALLPGRDEA